MAAPSRLGLSLWAGGQLGNKNSTAADLLTGRQSQNPTTVATASPKIGVRTYSTAPTEEQRSQVLARYADKLKQKAKEQGFSNVSELKSAYGEQIDKVRRSQAVPDAVQIPDEEPLQNHTASPKTQTSSPGLKSNQAPGVPTLDKFLDVEKIKTLPAEEVGQLWRLRHATNASSLAAVIPIDIWTGMLAKARKHPQFILPLPREISVDGSSKPGQENKSETGAELHFLQWTFPDNVRTSILFTHLAEYKLRGEFSSPHTTLTVHADLAESHKIVLLHGNVMPDRAIKTDDARFLLWGVQNFYGQLGQGSPRRQDLLDAFTTGDIARFDVQVLMQEVEKLA